MALTLEGFSGEKNDISINEPIEKLGIYDAEIKINPEVKAKVKLWVVKK